jgi:hypothetical protein
MVMSCGGARAVPVPRLDEVDEAKVGRCHAFASMCRSLHKTQRLPHTQRVESRFRTSKFIRSGSSPKSPSRSILCLSSSQMAVQTTSVRIMPRIGIATIAHVTLPTTSCRIPTLEDSTIIHTVAVPKAFVCFESN